MFEQNVAHDDWSVDAYFDSQPHDTARNNLIFNHPPDPSDYLYVGPDPYDALGRFSVCVMLADEENSSDATGNYANLDDAQVYNDVLAGCRIGIRDYAEGNAHAVRYHGLRNALIANNPSVMPFAPIDHAGTVGIFLQDNATPSGTNRNTGSVIANNVRRAGGVSAQAGGARSHAGVVSAMMRARSGTP